MCGKRNLLHWSMCGKRNLLHWSMCGKRNLLHWSMGGKRNHGTHPWAGKGYSHGCTETVWRWWVRRSSIGQATRLTSRWRWTGRCRCMYMYICTAMHSLRLKLCSIEYILVVVYVRLHIFISSLPLFKRPKKYRFYKSFLISKAIIWKCLYSLIRFLLYMRRQFLPLCMAAKCSAIGLKLSSSPYLRSARKQFPFYF